MAKGRVACVDLGDKEAKAMFSANILAYTKAEDLFAYSGLKFKRRPSWGELLVHRALFGDAFACSHGYLLNQRSLKDQVEKFFDNLVPPVPYRSGETEDAIYRLRCMMSQLRYVKKWVRTERLRVA